MKIILNDKKKIYPLDKNIQIMNKYFIIIKNN